jgi:hypothetical protein
MRKREGTGDGVIAMCGWRGRMLKASIDCSRWTRTILDKARGQVRDNALFGWMENGFLRANGRGETHALVGHFRSAVPDG